MINLEYKHRCRHEPIEAAIYSLRANVEELEMFRANASVDLTVDVEESTDEQGERKQERSCLELPVDFSKDDVTKV